MRHQANADRYAGAMPYRRCGRSGIHLPAISLGLWQNFGQDDDPATARQILLHAFDRGVAHFDIANNYGNPAGSAEELVGTVLANDLAGHRDELFISTKAGWGMWPGPYGDGGSRKHLIASCDQSLKRLGLDYVDVLYSHRPDPSTPLDETMAALIHLHKQGKALYIGISSYSPSLTREAAAILTSADVPLFVHQPSYSMLNRWIEDELLDTLEDLGTGCIAFSALAQGLLTDRYLNGIPEDSRASLSQTFPSELVNAENIKRVVMLNDIAGRRGQSLAQMAIAWVLRDPRIASALIGVRSVTQLDQLLDATHNLEFSAEDLRAIDEYAVDGGINLWHIASDLVKVGQA